MIFSISSAKIFSFPTLPLVKFSKRKRDVGKFPFFFWVCVSIPSKKTGSESENEKLRCGGGRTPHTCQCQESWRAQEPKPKLDPSGGGKGGPISKL